MCVIGSMLVHCLVSGYSRSYGLIYVQLQSRFDSSAALTAVVGSSCIAVGMCGSESCLQLYVYVIASVAEWLRAWDTLTMFEATMCGRS